MPKRSNDFQRLIYLVRLNLAEGAKVTESKLMRDRLTRRFREVDIVIEGKVGAQQVIVSIECRDHKRVADVTWIDAMKAKHDRLGTHALLLASRLGFTPEAQDVAAKYGIELFSLDNVETTNIPALLGRDGSLWFKSVSATTQHVSIRVAEIDDLAPETIASNPDNLLYSHNGTELCQVKEFVDGMLKSPHVRDYLLREGKEDHVWFEFSWEPPTDQEGRPLYMKKLEPEVFRFIESIRIVGPCKVEIGRFGMRHGKIGDVSIAWGKTQIGNYEAMAVATTDVAGQSKLSVNFSDTN